MTDFSNHPTVQLKRLRSRHQLNHRCYGGPCEYARELQAELDKRAARDASFMRQFYPRRIT